MLKYQVRQKQSWQLFAELVLLSLLIHAVVGRYPLWLLTWRAAQHRSDVVRQ